MGRTRAALLEATGECVARYGIRKTTMVDVASKSRVAKATLYNHFRTKGDVLAAMVEQQVSELVGSCVAVASAEGLTAALSLAARQIAASPPLRKAADGEQALLAPLATPSTGRGWQAVRDGVAAVLTAAGTPASAVEVELVLRWAVSQILWPLAAEDVPASAEALARGLHSPVPRQLPLTSAAGTDGPAAPVAPVPASASVGWPG